DLTDHDVHSRELVVARVAISEVSALVDKGARVLDTGPTWTTIEFAGEGEEVGGFVDQLRRHGILDVVRSGPVVMRRTAAWNRKRYSFSTPRRAAARDRQASTWAPTPRSASRASSRGSASTSSRPASRSLRVGTSR